MDNNQAIGITVGLLTGAIVGGAIALLYAPESGKKTRRMIKREVIAARDRAGDYAEDIKEFAGDVNRKGHAAMNALKN